MRKHYLLVLFTTLLAYFALAQNMQADKLNAYFDILEQNNKFMGSVSIFKDGKEIYSKTVGYADVDSKLRADMDTRYCIGSISKTFTAVLIFKAIENGKLSLTQTLDKFFPDINNSDKITIAQMLRHNSGVPNYTDGVEYLTWNKQFKTRQEMLSIIEKSGSDFEPGSKISYSNSNYVLLSFILEDIHEKSFTEIFNSEIKMPLGLKNTSFGEKINLNKHYCNSYIYLDRWHLQTQTDVSTILGAGGISSTPYDINVFAEALFSGKLINNNSLEQMMTVKNNVGLGLFKIPFYDKWGYGHGGNIDGYSSHFAYFPEDHISYALASNGMNYVRNDISIAILSALYNRPFDIPDFTTVNLTSEDLDKYLGIYSSSQLPIKLTITKNGNVLIAQGTGQSSFNLEFAGKDKFRFFPAKIQIEFKPCENTLILRQGGGVFVMKKD